jgi:hypothetical protein
MESGSTMSTTASSARKALGFPHTRIAVVGSRDFPSEKMVGEVLAATLNPWNVVISGGAKGPDTWAASYADNMDIPCCVHKPDWSKGKAAGLARNTTIVRDSDAVLAFWDGKSRGTLDSIQKAKALGKVVVVVLPDGRVLSNYGKVST